MKSPVQLSCNSASVDVVTWSRDNRIAIASEKAVHILTHSCTAGSGDDFLLLSQEQVVEEQGDIQELDLAIDQEKVDQMPKSSFTKQRFILNKVDGFDPPKSKGSSAVKLSTACDDNKRSLLASVTSGNKLSVYSLGKGGSYVRKNLHLSNDLYGYAQQRAFNLVGSQPSDKPTPPSSDFEVCQDRRLAMCTTKIEWSGIFTSPCVEEENKTEEEKKEVEKKEEEKKEKEKKEAEKMEAEKMEEKKEEEKKEEKKDEKVEEKMEDEKKEEKKEEKLEEEKKEEEKKEEEKKEEEKLEEEKMEEEKKDEEEEEKEEEKKEKEKKEEEKMEQEKKEGEKMEEEKKEEKKEEKLEEEKKAEEKKEEEKKEEEKMEQEKMEEEQKEEDKKEEEKKDENEKEGEEEDLMAAPPAKRRRLDTSTTQNQSFILLAAASKNDDVVLWKISCPVQESTTAEVAAVVTTGSGHASSLAWYHPDETNSQRAFLVTGSLEGLITVWSVVAVGGSVAVSKMLDVWPEKDGVLVQAVTWINKLCTGNSFTFVACKGPFMLAFNLQHQDGNLTVLHQSHSAALHTALISGIVCSGDNVYTSSTDGSIQRAVVSQENGVSLDLSLLEPTSCLTTRVDGIALSPSGIYLAVVKRHSMLQHYSCVTKLSFITLTSGQDIGKLLGDLNVGLCQKSDCLDWLYRQLSVEGALHPIAEGILSAETLGDTDEGEALKRLQLCRMVMLMLKHKLRGMFHDSYGSKRVGYGERLRAEEERIRLCTGQLIKSHIKRQIGNIQAVNDSSEGRSKIVLKLMTDWLGRDITEECKPMGSNSSSAPSTIPDSYESCRLCGRDIPFTHVENGTCANGHFWSRCSLSLLLCQTLKPRRCSYCGVSFSSPDSADPEWLRELLKLNCTFCDGPLSDR